jgi:hypothetical protein
VTLTIGNLDESLHGTSTATVGVVFCFAEFECSSGNMPKSMSTLRVFILLRKLFCVRRNLKRIGDAEIYSQFAEKGVFMRETIRGYAPTQRRRFTVQLRYFWPIAANYTRDMVRTSK